jgi:DnaK suppressor protein
MSNTMDNSRKVVIRTIIEKRIAELQRILSSSDEEEGVRNEQLSDEATRLDALASLAVDSSLQARAEIDLRLLQRQLQRIDHEEFGLCHLCGEEISANRIASVPATELCITCAEQQEKKQ